MNQANRKRKLSKYVVNLKREVEFVAEVEVMARNAEEAEDMAVNEADAAGANFWRESDVTSQSARAKIVR